MAWQSALASHAAYSLAQGPLSAQLVQSEHVAVGAHTAGPPSVSLEVVLPPEVEG